MKKRSGKVKAGRRKSSKFTNNQPRTKRRKNTRTKKVLLFRPVTVCQIGEAIDMQPFRLMDRLAEFEISTSPSEEVDDASVKQLGRMLKVRFVISDDPRGGVIDHGKVGPVIPDSLEDSQQWG